MPESNLPKILVVDDEGAQMKALCDTLRDHGFEVAGYASPRAALEQIAPDRFALILTDLMMPEMDGISLLRAAHEKDAHLVGIVMTGEGTITTAVDAMKAGALDYILKPFKLSAILPVLDRALSMRSLRLENERLALELQERTVKLEEANKELEAFSYSVSHDLRAPLRHIAGFADFINEEPESADRKQYLDRIIKLTKDMDNMIRALLEFSQLGRAHVRHTGVDLAALASDVLEKLQPEMAGRNIEWTRGALPKVQGDPALLRQVLSNLLLNAIKYTRPRDVAKIEIGSRPEGEEVLVFVRDNGVGFDMNGASQLFNVFQRLHRKEDFEGTGVGLANVRRIIERHGGRAWAEGKVNEGATFFVSLHPAPSPPAAVEAH